jgi:hypothetical protein
VLLSALRLLIFEFIADGAQIYDCDANDGGFDCAFDTRRHLRSARSSVLGLPANRRAPSS